MVELWLRGILAKVFKKYSEHALLNFICKFGKMKYKAYYTSKLTKSPMSIIVIIKRHAIATE